MPIDKELYFAKEKKKSSLVKEESVRKEVCFCGRWPEANLEPNWIKTSEAATTQTVASVP